MFFVYILKSEIASKSYVGMTNDIERRMQEHNSGKHAYTKRFIPWKIIHTETFQSLTEARKKEKYYKSAAGRRFLAKNIFKNS